jgi:uncharacterized protein (TIGR04255 family)
MPFPETRRVIYRRNPLAEVAAKLRFQPILKIDSEAPAQFQDQIRLEYPQYADNSAVSGFPSAAFPPEMPPQFAALIQGLGGGRTGGARHQFSSQDGKWHVVLTRESLELGTSAYTRWEEFRDRFVKVSSAMERSYTPPAYSRIGLRYFNVIRRSALKADNVPWSELIQPYIAGELSTTELAGGIDSASRQLHCRLGEDNCYLTLKTGLALAEPTKEKCFVIDSDIHTHGLTETTSGIPTLNGFNQKSRLLFRWCIRERLHDALDPTPAD